MRYAVRLKASARKELGELARPTVERIAAAIDKLAGVPRPAAARPLVDNPYYRLRVGDYRIIYEVQDKVLVILVIRIGHRREIYRK